MSVSRRYLRCFPIFCILAVLLSGVATAQTTSGTITGTVTDASGAVVPDAKIVLTDELTKDSREAQGSESGEFVFAALRPSTYAISIEKPGFQMFRRTGIVLASSERVALGTIRLTVGQSSESVTISAQATPINTEGADTAPALNQVQLANIPIAGRDVMNLLRVLPGVGSLAVNPWGGEMGPSDPAGSAASNGGQFGSFTPNVGGARLFWNTVMVDGQVGSNPDFPGLFMSAMSMDAVAEAKIISHNYTSEYGRNPGPTISLVTKSGTSEYHGAVYAYKRHEGFNANDFFNNRDGLPKPIYRFGTLGGAVGGPIFIPGHFNSDRKKLFFFYSHEQWWTKLPQGITHVTVPTAAERAGDFSQTLDQAGNLRIITDPKNGLPFPNNRVPDSRFNSNGLVLLNLMPQPNFVDPNRNYNFVWQDSCEIPKRLDSLKIDYYPHEKDLISIHPRSWWSDTRAYQCNVLAYGGNVPIMKDHYKYLTDSAVINWTHTFSPTMINEFGIGFTGEKERGPADNLFGRTVENYFDPVKRSTNGFTLGQFYPAANQYDIMPGANFGFVPSGPSIGANARYPDHQGYERFHFLDNFSLIRNKHTFKFGIYFERNWATDGPHADCFDGCFDFTHDIYNPLDTGWDFANALVGNFKEYRESNSRQEYQMQNNVAEWFAQDTFKVTRKLTIDIGVRFSWFTPWYVGKGLGAEFIPSKYDPSQVPPLYRPAQDPNGAPGSEIAQNPVTGAYAPAAYIGAFTGPFNFSGTILSTDKSYPRGFREQHSAQLAPRFGIAWDPFGDGKTAIRTGFGIIKETVPTYNSYAWSMVSNPPVQIEPHIFYGAMDTLLQRQGLLFPVGSSALQLKDKVPSVYKYSFGIQRELPWQTSIDVSYVGNVGRHLIQGTDLNELPYGARFLPQNKDPLTGAALPDDFYRPYPGYEGIFELGNFGWSNFNSLQVGVNKRYSRGLQLGLAYTWAHALGTGSTDGDGLARYRSWRVWNYGPPNFDQRQVLTITYVWDLPKASRMAPNHVVKFVLDDWQLSGVTTFATGLPRPIFFGTSDGADITGGGDCCRADLVANATAGGGSFYHWFNQAAFARPAQGTPGNAPVAPIYNPGQNNFDMTLMKKFPLWSEKRSIQFRAEFYNVFNHTHFASVDSGAVFDPDGTQINGQFGQIVSMRAPRVIQFSLRLEF